MAYSKNERDDFWNLEKLVPKRKTPTPNFSSSPTPVEHNVSAPETQNADRGKIDFGAYRTEIGVKERSYEPRRSSLIKKVTISSYPDKYDFYGNFRKAALIYFDYRTDPCDFVPFYSYMPQYSQLTPEQRAYYFYWRAEWKKGRVLRSDYSYVYLFAYEVLNLPDKIPPEEGLSILARLWRDYRSTLPRIDAYMSLWIEDFCLVYGLEYPMHVVRDFVFDAVSGSLIKELYLSELTEAGELGIDAVLLYLSDYDYRRGLSLAGDSRALYERYMRSAMRIFLTSTGALEGAYTRGVGTLKRDAFLHSLCTHAVKCRISVEYTRLAEDTELRKLVTGAVRFTENKLRALLGIKSRLAVRDFSEEHKAIISSFFDRLIEKERRERAKREAPEYEKLYDAPSTELSFRGADEIERLSWSNTARLVENTEDEPTENEPEKTPIEKAPVTEMPAEAPSNSSYGLSDGDISLIRALLSGEANIDDAVAERINEAFADGFGDVILTYGETGYEIIEDYREDISEWLKSLTR